MTAILHTGKGILPRPRRCNGSTAAGAVSVATYLRPSTHHDRKRARVHPGAGSVKGQLKKHPAHRGWW